MSASMTFQHANAFDAFGSRFFAAVSSTINKLAIALTSVQAREPRTAEELIEWAHTYESTQPSYAADLRAAALRYQDNGNR